MNQNFTASLLAHAATLQMLQHALQLTTVKFLVLSIFSICRFVTSKEKIKEVVFALLLEEVIPFLDGSADPVTVS